MKSRCRLARAYLAGCRDQQRLQLYGVVLEDGAVLPTYRYMMYECRMNDNVGVRHGGGKGDGTVKQKEAFDGIGGREAVQW